MALNTTFTQPELGKLINGRITVDVAKKVKNVWFAENDHERVVFDYKALRLLMGLIALSLSIVVTLISHEELSSISGSYYTTGRDAFVGMLFIVGAFLWAYEGHYFYEGFASKIASVAAISVALAPTTCKILGESTVCANTLVTAHPIIHGTTAAALFLILTYFCLFPFRHKAIEKNTDKSKIRKWIYIVCGCVMLLSIAAIGANAAKLISGPRIVYYGETAALSAFGVAWIVAGQYFSRLSDHVND